MIGDINSINAYRVALAERNAALANRNAEIFASNQRRADKIRAGHARAKASAK